MKTIKNVVFIIAICMFVFSCKKDEKDSPKDYTFSKEDADVNKAKVEDAGQLMITEMKAMESSSSQEVLEAFVDCSEYDDPFGTAVTKSTPVFRTIEAASSLTLGKSSLSHLSKVMKSDVSDDPNSFQEVYEKYKGIYTWNTTTKVWTKAVSNEFKFMFPSKKGETTNNATLVLTYTGKTGLLPLENYDGDLPATFNAAITVNNTKVFEIDLKASYNGDGYPTSVNYFIALYPYKYEVTWSYSSSSVSIRYHLSNGSKNILDYYAKVNGNFSKSKIEGDMDDTDLYSGEAYFQVFNIKVAGDIDYKGLYQKELQLEEQYNKYYKVDSAMCKELNNYVHLDLILADSKQKIGKVEFYPTVSTHTYYWGTVTEVDLNSRFIFGDGSTGDLDAYFGSGFEDFFRDLNSFIDQINTDYDLGFEQIDY